LWKMATRGASDEDPSSAWWRMLRLLDLTFLFQK
jgi:hypothetical protein